MINARTLLKATALWSAILLMFSIFVVAVIFNVNPRYLDTGNAAWLICAELCGILIPYIFLKPGRNWWW